MLYLSGPACFPSCHSKLSWTKTVLLTPGLKTCWLGHCCLNLILHLRRTPTHLPTYTSTQSTWQEKETSSISKVGSKYGSHLATSSSSVSSKAKCDKEVAGKGPPQREVG